jgi:hypothetical protein
MAKKRPPTHQARSGNKSAPPLTEEQAQAYMQFSDACKKIYDKSFKSKIDTRITQLESSPALVAVVRFMVMVHDFLEVYGVMQFNKNISPTLYEHLNDIQDKTGQTLPLARVLLDGIKATKMELLANVTVHPLPEFIEPEYEAMTQEKSDPGNPADAEFAEPDDAEFAEPEPADPEGEHDAPSHVGPGGPDFDDSVQPQSGTPIDPVDAPPAPQEEPQSGDSPAPQEEYPEEYPSGNAPAQ